MNNLTQEKLDVMFGDISSEEDAGAFINKCKECLSRHICEEYILYKIEDPEGILHDALKDYYTLDRPCVMDRAVDSLMMNIELFTKNSSYDFSPTKYGVNENGNIIIVGNGNMKTE